MSKPLSRRSRDFFRGNPTCLFGGVNGVTSGIGNYSFHAVSAGGTGKTTTEMQTAKVFIDAGWDFVGETVNGTEGIWWILEGKDYPRLWWEGSDEALRF